MASNFPLDSVSEEIENIGEVMDEASSNLEPPTRRSRGYAKADHTRTAKGIFDSIKKCDTCQHVQDLRRKLVIDYERLEDMHDYIVFSLGKLPDEVELEKTWFQRATDLHRKALNEADRYLRPPATPSLPQTKASSRSSSRSSSHRSTSSQRLLDAQLAEQKLKLQLRHHQEDKQEDARQASLEAERTARQASLEAERTARQASLEAERITREANLEVERKALEAEKGERRIKQQLELASLEKQVLTKQLSGSQGDEIESLDLRPPRANAFSSTQMTPPASRLGLGGGFFIPVSDPLPAQEGDAAVNSRISPLLSYGYGGDQAQLDADSDTDDGHIDWTKQPPVTPHHPALLSQSVFRSPSAIRPTYLGCVPKTSAVASTAITQTVRTVSSASVMSGSNPNSEPSVSQAAPTRHGPAPQPAQPINGFAPQLENRVGPTSQPPAVSVTSTEPIRFQLQPLVPRSIEQTMGPVYRDQGNFPASRPQPSNVQRPIPQYATSTSIAANPYPATLAYSQLANRDRPAGPVSYPTSTFRLHGPAMQPMQTYAQPTEPMTYPFQPETRPPPTDTLAPSRYGPPAQAARVSQTPLTQPAAPQPFYDPRQAPAQRDMPTRGFSSDWISTLPHQAPVAPAAPDGWLYDDNVMQFSSQGLSNTRPPKSRVPRFDGNPRNWPNFIVSFKTHVHDVCANDQERLTHLKSHLVPLLADSIGSALNVPGLYQATLRALQRDYGNPRAVAASCSADLLKIQPFKDEDPQGLRRFTLNLRAIVNTLELGGYGGELYANSSLRALEDKLPTIICDKWAVFSDKIVGRLPNVSDLNDFLETETRLKFSVRTDQLTFPDSKTPGKQPANTKSQEKSRKPGRGPRVHSTAVTDVKCAVCPGNHLVPSCAQFTSLSLEKRGEMVKEKRLCFRCLGTGHIASDCPRTEACGTGGCKSRHHSLMHGVPRLHPAIGKPGKPGKAVETPRGVDSKVVAEKAESKTFTGTTIVAAGNTTPLLPIVAVILRSHKHSFKTYALLDTGSEATLIRQDVADKLALEGPVEPSRISTYHADDPKATTKRVDFQIHSVDGSNRFEVRRAHTVPQLHLKKRAVAWSGVLGRWPHLSGLKFPTHRSNDVTVIIGYDHPDLLDVIETRKDPLRSGSPRALLTPFGWCVVGPVTGERGTERIDCNAITMKDPAAIFTRLVEDFFLNDTLGTKPDVKLPVGAEEQRAISILEETTKFADGHFEVGLLRRSDDAHVPNNFPTALRRFDSTERKRTLQDVRRWPTGVCQPWPRPQAHGRGRSNFHPSGRRFLSERHARNQTRRQAAGGS